MLLLCYSWHQWTTDKRSPLGSWTQRHQWGQQHEERNGWKQSKPNPRACGHVVIVLTWHVYTQCVAADARAWLATLRLKWNIDAVSRILMCDETPIKNTRRAWNRIFLKYHNNVVEILSLLVKGKQLLSCPSVWRRMKECLFDVVDQNAAGSDTVWCFVDRMLKHKSSLLHSTSHVRSLRETGKICTKLVNVSSNACVFHVTDAFFSHITSTMLLLRAYLLTLICPVELQDHLRVCTHQTFH